MADLERVLWVPVRHHSPAAARATVALITERRPEAVLIEGPSDVGDLPNLLRGHTLPISQMSWARWTHEGAEHQSYALYPFTEFSAEWQAIATATELGIEVRFIDLPWADQLALSRRQQTDAQELPGTDSPGALQHDVAPDESFYRTLADFVGREDLAAVWDEFFEIAPLAPSEYLTRASTLGAGLRSNDRDRGGVENRAREEHMAGHIRSVLARTSGTVLVLTGAFHTDGLRDLLASDEEPAPLPAAELALPGLVTGHALVPSSYEELDADRGYLAGQPSPGFYDRVFASPAASEELVEGLFNDLIGDLRRRKVQVSVADSIAAMTTAKGLQQIRGHARMWRDDLVDGITAAVVKDDLTEHHPLLESLRRTLRGTKVGQLAADAEVPPLVDELHRRWDDARWPKGRETDAVTLDLTVPADLERSRLLHLCVVLDIPAAVDHTSRTSGVNARTVVARQEHWKVGWHLGCDRAAILASRWGGGAIAAASAVLQHRALRAGPEELAEILGTAVAIGLDDLSGRLADGLAAAVGTSSELPALGRALDRLIGFVHFDTWLGTVGRSDLRELTSTVHQRMVEVLGQLPAQAEGPHVQELNRALRSMAEATATGDLALEATVLDHVLLAQLQPHAGTAGSTPVRHAPEFLGGLQAARWLLSGDPGQALEASLGDPVGTGQFYSGLLTVAGHLALAAPQIFDAADDALTSWHGDDFLAALPDLRRAMTHLTRRERDSLLRHLTGDAAASVVLRVDEATFLDLARQEADLEQQVAHWLPALPFGHGPGGAQHG